jgi:F-type H+-transporting ATPase subunit delta
VQEPALRVIRAVVDGRWSSHDELLAGIEELGIRAVAVSAPEGTPIEAELFTFGRAVGTADGLELALGDKLGDAQAKSTLVHRLLGGRASEQTAVIVEHLVQQPRGRRIGELVRHAATLVADQAGLTIATVRVASPLSPEQSERLAQALSRRYSRRVELNQVVDRDLVGGLRVQIGDDVIDGSVATRINDLRLQFA